MYFNSFSIDEEIRVGEMGCTDEMGKKDSVCLVFSLDVLDLAEARVPWWEPS